MGYAADEVEPEGDHDGYEVVATQESAGAGQADGTLARGRFFAVALYVPAKALDLPGYAESNDRPAGRKEICYGEDSTAMPGALGPVLSTSMAGATAPLTTRPLA